MASMPSACPPDAPRATAAPLALASCLALACVEYYIWSFHCSAPIVKRSSRRAAEGIDRALSLRDPIDRVTA
eukprot:9137606-Pyramimonas_sp.AAC.2